MWGRRIRALAVLVGLYAIIASGARAGEPAWLGILFGDAADGGVQVIAVAPGSPASVGHLRDGDVLVRLGDRDVTDRAALERVVASIQPGAPVSFRVIRGGHRVDGVITPVARDEWTWLRGESRGPLARAMDWGLETRQIPEDLRRHLGAPSTAGLLVVRVEEGGPAASAGVRVGDVLVRVAGRDLRVPTDLFIAARAEASQGRVTVSGIRRRKPIEATISNRPPEIDARARLEGERDRLRQEIERVERALRELEGPR